MENCEEGNRTRGRERAMAEDAQGRVAGLARRTPCGGGSRETDSGEPSSGRDEHEAKVDHTLSPSRTRRRSCPDIRSRRCARWTTPRFPKADSRLSRRSSMYSDSMSL